MLKVVGFSSRYARNNSESTKISKRQFKSNGYLFWTIHPVDRVSGKSPWSGTRGKITRSTYDNVKFDMSTLFRKMKFKIRPPKLFLWVCLFILKGLKKNVCALSYVFLLNSKPWTNMAIGQFNLNAFKIVSVILTRTGNSMCFALDSGCFAN